LAIGDGGLDGAAGVGVVLAVAEFTLKGELVEVLEGFAEGGFISPHVDFTNAGVIDDEAASGEGDELSPGGGVAAFSGEFIDVASGEFVALEEGVDKGGFTDAGGADEGDSVAFSGFFRCLHAESHLRQAMRRLAKFGFGGRVL